MILVYVSVCIYAHICMHTIYIYTYTCTYRYHMMTDVYTAALLPTKPSSDDDSEFRHGFRAKASLPLTQSASAVTNDTIRLWWIDVTRWDYHIHADAVRDLPWIFSMYFLLSDGESPRLVKNMEVELVMKLQHLTVIGNTLVIEPFQTHCSCWSSYFSNSHWCGHIYIYICSHII